MRKRLTMQILTETPQDDGTVLESWATDGSVGSVWAEILPLRGDEFFEARKVDATVTHRVLTRHIGDFGVQKPKNHRFRNEDGTRFFHVLSVINPEERNIVTEFLCKEEV